MESAKHLAGVREFSAQLAQRLAEAPQRDARAAHLGVRIGSRSYLVEMASVGEIVPRAQIARVPWTRPWFRGLTNVRGRLVGVYDLLQLAGAEPLTDTQSLQLLVFGEWLKVGAALLITRAFGLRNARELEAVAATGGAAWEGASFRDLDGSTLIELDLARLAAEPAFVSIGA